MTLYYPGDQLKKVEMGGKCAMHGGYERCLQDFGGETWGKDTTWKT